MSLIILPALLLMNADVAFSEDVTTQTKAAPSELDKLLETVNGQGIIDSFSPDFTALADQLSVGLSATTDDKKFKKFKNEMNAYVKRFREKYYSMAKLKPALERVYLDSFSVEEIKSLNEFFASPVGQKYLRAQPLMSTKMQAVIRGINEQHTPELSQGLMAIRQKYFSN